MSTQKNGAKSPTSSPPLSSIEEPLTTTLHPNGALQSALTFTTENLPNAAKVINSLRHLGYNNYAAIKDICDNSNDAHATEVRILLEQEGKSSYSITIVDNGKGMDWQTLDQALRLGSDTERDEMSDPGKFGMGLVTASLSICRRVEVITKEEYGPILYSVQDVDEVISRNYFVKHLSEAEPREQEMFTTLLPGADHGTVVRLTRCDHLQNKNASQFASRLRKELGQTFRYFLASGQMRMWINQEPVEPIDPMMMTEGAEEYSRETYTIDFVDEEGVSHSGQYELRLVKLPDLGQEGNKNRGISFTNQGFYLLRNYREIAAGETFGLFNKHPVLNRFRGEIFVPGTLDELLGVDFTKQKLNFKQAFFDKLNQELKGQISSIGTQLKAKKAADSDSDLLHEEAARQIGQKAHLLVKPKLDIEKRGSRADNEATERKEPETTKERVNITKAQKRKSELPCRFETASMTPAGPIWDSHQVGRTLVIRWNVDHPFYQRFILENQDNPSMITATDYLVYSFCAAERVFNDDDDNDSYEIRQDTLESIRTILSTNMRKLLSVP